ncbi:MAG: SDR family oxidoreductase [Bryobacteraceae bacterium]|nr:SDR family oxidoreductase [Bryobacteraceae bacterium]
MSKKLEGKTALVTGASRGIGRAIAVRLAEDGANVLVHYGKSAEAAEEVAGVIRKAGGTAAVLGGDLSSSAGVTELVSGVAKTLGQNGVGKKLDILVNNAGIAEYSNLETTTEEYFDRLFQINVKALFFITQNLVNHIPDGGRIVNVSSVVSRAAFPNILPYAATKGAVDVLTRHLASELGPRNITVNSVAPGAIDTDMGAWVRTDEGAAAVRAMQALQETGKPEFVASAVAFLVSSDGHWVTGQVLDASGGSKL